MTRKKHVVKVSRTSKPPHRIRVIRVSRPSDKPTQDRGTSRISSVDSWLSDAPSIEEAKIQVPSKKFTIQRFTPKSAPEDQTFRRTCLAMAAAVLVIIAICSIVGIVLAVTLQSSTSSTSTIATTTISLLQSKVYESR